MGDERGETPSARTTRRTRPQVAEITAADATAAEDDASRPIRPSEPPPAPPPAATRPAEPPPRGGARAAAPQEDLLRLGAEQVEHLEHFGLSRDPFSNDPQLSVYFPSAEHASAERRLRRGVTQQKGLCLLTGPGGRGQEHGGAPPARLRSRRRSTRPASSCRCRASPTSRWVLSRFAAHLGVDEPVAGARALLAQIYDQMAVIREDGRHVVLILDESDVLAERGALGDLRALLNLEYEERRLLTLVLVGPTEIEDRSPGSAASRSASTSTCGCARSTPTRRRST